VHPPLYFILIGFAAVICLSRPAAAFSELQCYTFKGCGGGRSSSSSTNPSYGNEIRINPSAVPTEKGIGLEGILYKNEADFAIVQGLGRVGAALSPSNSEETFFGPPGVELESDYLLRKQKGDKLPNQKLTLATAVSIIKKKGSGLKAYGLQLGVMGRYNRLTHSVHPGAGLNGILGPFTFGGSMYNDETQIDLSEFGSIEKPVVDYQVSTYNGGISLGSLLLDYSVLQMKAPDHDETATVRLLTGSLLVRKIILTISKRTEDSNRQAYNFSTKELEDKRFKEDTFGGIQVNATKNLMFGLLYNYYLMHEYSLTATLFL